jgi:hypothetical protein
MMNRMNNFIGYFSGEGEQNINYLPSNIKVIDSLKQVISIFDRTDFVENEDFTDWLQLRAFLLSKEESQLWSSANLDTNEMIEKMDRLQESINRGIYKCVLKNIFPEFLRELPIAEDIGFIFSCRILSDSRWVEFANALGNIYLSGYIPCGWIGEFPNKAADNGQWLVYKVNRGA